MNRTVFNISFLAFLVLSLAFPQIAVAQSVTIDGLVYIINDSEAKVFSVDNYQGTELVIPNAIKYGEQTYPVTEIASKALMWTGFTKITIPASVVYIGQGAIRNCQNLKTVVFEKRTTTLQFDNYSFVNFDECPSLTGVYVPDLKTWMSMEFVDGRNYLTGNAHHLYINNKELTDLVIPTNITEIKPYSFEGLTNLKSVTLHDKVKSVGVEAFYDCPSLTTVKCPDLSTWLNIDFGSSHGLLNNAHLYLNNSELTDLVIPSSRTTIKDNAFYGYKPLRSITFHDKVKSIDVSAFGGCINLTEVILPDSIERISGFNGCTGLKNVYLGKNAKYIGIFAFSGCTGLTSVTIPNTVDTIDMWAFRNCVNLKTVTMGKRPMKIIKMQAFQNCNKLETVVLSPVGQIAAYTFQGCTALKSFYLRGYKQNYSSNFFRDVDLTSTTLYVPRRQIEYYKQSDWKVFPQIEPWNPYPGDLNMDYETNTGDVSLLYKNLLEGSGIEYSDLNDDGTVNTGDVSALYKMILGQ